MSARPYESGLSPQAAGWFSHVDQTHHGAQPTAYLAGPMRGYPLYNFRAFFDAVLRLRAAGWHVHNPAEYDMAEGLDPSQDDPGAWPITIQDMLRTDFGLILNHCNAVIVLRGWEESKGSRMELAIAAYTGLPIYELRGLELKKLVLQELPEVSFETFDRVRKEDA
jgi:hypothetical protein